MASSHTEIYIHYCWATKGRRPLLTRRVWELLVPIVSHACIVKRCRPIAFGGIEDHVHLLCRMRATVSPSDLMKHVKGLSSHNIDERLGRGTLYWQPGFGAFSVYPRDLDIVIDYVNNQAEHHRRVDLVPDLEICNEEEARALARP